MMLLIDNYDSFTYNLFQYLSELGATVVVVRNDKTTLDEIEAHGAGEDHHFARSLNPAAGRHIQRRHPAFRRAQCRFSACAWDTSASAIPTAGQSRARKSIMHGKSSLIHHKDPGRLRRDSPTPSPPSATTRWP